MQQKNEEWQIVFWITFGVLVLTTLVYMIWASGEIQSWNENTKEDNWLRRLFTRKSARLFTRKRANAKVETEM